MKRGVAAALVAASLAFAGPAFAQSAEPASPAARTEAFSKLPYWPGFWVSEQYLHTTISGNAAPRPPGSPPLDRLNGFDAPYNDEGKARQAEAARTRAGRRADGWGYPMMMDAATPFQVMITPEETMIANGYGEVRHIYTDGRPFPAEEDMGKWNGSVSAALASGSAKLAKSVGRIQPVGGHASKFSGTGTLVKADPGLVLTNYHVIQHAKNRFGVAMTPAGDHWKVDGDLEIDFAGEAGSSDEQRFRIIEVRFPQGSGETFAGIDAAICRIVPHNGDTTTVMPKPAEVLSANDDYINGSITSLALIGFPAPPQFDNQDVDWDWVVRTLFGYRFGVKRLAPGLFTEKLGNNQNDTKKLAIGHDATTFGGASGSLVAAWLDNKTPAFALHFGGLTRKGNYALSFKAAQAALAAIGVPV